MPPRKNNKPRKPRKKTVEQGPAAIPVLPPVRRGPPLELDRVSTDRIVASVRLGARIGAAVQAEGFSRDAYRRWLRVGTDVLEKLKADPASILSDTEDLYFYLLVEYTKAIGQLECEASHLYFDRSQGDAEDLREWLSARFPNGWGKKQKVDVMQTSTVAITQKPTPVKLTSDDLVRLADIAERAGLVGPSAGSGSLIHEE